MLNLKPVLAATALAALAACQSTTEVTEAQTTAVVGETATVVTTTTQTSEVPVVAPTVTNTPTGAILPANSLVGDYNLQRSQCGVANSDTGLTVTASSFTFGGTQCKVLEPGRTQGTSTRVTLSCNSGTTSFNRIVDLSLSPTMLRLTEDSKTLTYYKCGA